MTLPFAAWNVDSNKTMKHPRKTTSQVGLFSRQQQKIFNSRPAQDFRRWAE
jgi:hypothetical protein